MKQNSKNVNIILQILKVKNNLLPSKFISLVSSKWLFELDFFVFFGGPIDGRDSHMFPSEQVHNTFNLTSFLFIVITPKK